MVEDIELSEKERLNKVIEVLTKTREAIAKEDAITLKQLSDETIHNGMTHQDSLSLIVAVLVYSVSKLLQRENYQKMEGWEIFYDALIKNIDLIVSSLSKGDQENALLYAGKIRNSINKIDGDLRTYIQDVFRKAEINKAFKIYEHGLSAEQTAKLLGVSLWDLASYIGQSTISEASVGQSVPVKKRIKIAEEFFQ